jgi:hypothetical protein
MHRSLARPPALGKPNVLRSDDGRLSANCNSFMHLATDTRFHPWHPVARLCKLERMSVSAESPIGSGERR